MTLMVVVYGAFKFLFMASIMKAKANSIAIELAIILAIDLVPKKARINNIQRNRNDRACAQSPKKVKKLKVLGSEVKRAGNPQQNIDIPRNKLASAMYSEEILLLFL